MYQPSIIIGLAVNVTLSKSAYEDVSNNGKPSSEEQLAKNAQTAYNIKLRFITIHFFTCFHFMHIVIWQRQRQKSGFIAT